MKFYQPVPENVSFLVQRCYFEADQTRVALALERLSSLRERFPNDARILYAEGIIRRDHLGQGLRARDVFEEAYRAAFKSKLQGDYCWFSASNATGLARDESEFRKWVQLTESAPPLGQGNRPAFTLHLQDLARGISQSELVLQNAEAEYVAGHIGSSAALMDVALSGGGLDRAEEADVRRYRAQRIRELDQKCEAVRESLGEWFSSDDRVGLREALAELDRALEVDPYDAELWNLASAWNNLLERFDVALRAGARASELRSPYPKAHVNAARALYRLERYDEAERQMDLASEEANSLQDREELEQIQRLTQIFSHPPQDLTPDDLVLSLERVLFVAKRCSDTEMEAVQGDVDIEDLINRLIDHAGFVTGAMGAGYVPMIAEILSDFTPETVCNVIIKAKQRAPQMVDDWVYATLFIVANSCGVERRDAARLMSLLLFIPLDAKRVHDNYRHLVLGPASVKRHLDALDTMMRQELRRINPQVEKFVTSQTPLSEAEKAHAQREVSLRLTQSAQSHARTAVPAPRSSTSESAPREAAAPANNGSLPVSNNWLRSITALTVGFTISYLFSTLLILVVAYLTFPLLSDETPSALGARIVLLACSVLSDGLAGFAVAKIVRRGRIAHAVLLGIAVALWVLYDSPDGVSPSRLIAIAAIIPAVLGGAMIGRAPVKRRVQRPQ